MSQTVYVPVEASNVATFAVEVPSGADTTSGYYITYDVALSENGGGYTGTGWYLQDTYNNDPFEGYDGINTEQDIIDLYSSSGNNLNAVFSSWLTRVSDVGVSNFCNMLMNGQAYTNGCIRLAN